MQQKSTCCMSLFFYQLIYECERPQNNTHETRDRIYLVIKYSVFLFSKTNCVKSSVSEFQVTEIKEAVLTRQFGKLVGSLSLFLDEK